MNRSRQAAIRGNNLLFANDSINEAMQTPARSPENSTTRSSARIPLLIALVALSLYGCSEGPAASSPSTAPSASTPPSIRPASSQAAPAAPDRSGAAESSRTAAAGKPRTAPAGSGGTRLAQAEPQRPPAGTPPAGDWPQFRGPGGMGVGPASTLPVRWSENENILWKAPLPGPGTSSPITFGNRIYLTCYSGYGVPDQPGGSPDQVKRHLLCLDRKTGAQIWNKEVGGAGAEEASIRENHGYASSTPAVDSDRLYAFFGRSGVYAFNHQGEQLWRTSVGERTNGWGSAASLLLFGNLVIVNASVESDSLVALDRATGREVWRQTGIKESWNTPIVVTAPGGRKELVVGIFRKILAFDPASGAPLWSCDTGIDWYMVPSMVARDGIVYCIGGRSGGCLAVRAGGSGDVTATHRLWTGKNGSNVSSPVILDDHLYWAKDSPAIAYCAEAATGNIVYEERLEGAQIYASALAAGNHIYYISRSGRTFVLPARPTFRIEQTNELRDGGVWNASPVVTEGRLYLRSDRFLYCIGTG